MRPVRPAVAALLAALLLVLGACGAPGSGAGASDGHDGHGGHDDHAGHEGHHAATPRPSATGTPATGAHNDADVVFTAMMIPHHQQAVQMSDLVLAKDGVDAEVTALAQHIKDAQAPEIAQMNGWLVGWGNLSPATAMDHGDMGMMTAAQLQDLEQAGAAQAQQLFLAGMIKHHQGAVAMAQTELTDGTNPDARALAQAILTSQQAEIAQMQQLLQS